MFSKRLRKTAEYVGLAVMIFTGFFVAVIVGIGLMVKWAVCSAFDWGNDV